MASKFTCLCGTVIRTNLYEGHGLHLLVREGLTDLHEEEPLQSCGSFVNKLVHESPIVAKCPNCGVLALVDNEYRIELYAPISR